MFSTCSIRDHVLSTTKELALNVIAFLTSLQDLDAFVKAFLPLQPLMTGSMAYNRVEGTSPHEKLFQLTRSTNSREKYGFLHPRIRIEIAAKCIKDIKKQGSLDELELALLIDPLYFHIAEKVMEENPTFVVKPHYYVRPLTNLYGLSLTQLLKAVDWNVYDASQALAVCIYPDREDMARQIIEMMNPPITDCTIEHALLAAAEGKRKWLDEFLERGFSPHRRLEVLVGCPDVLLEMILWVRRQNGGAKLRGVHMMHALGSSSIGNLYKSAKMVLDHTDFSSCERLLQSIFCQMLHVDPPPVAILDMILSSSGCRADNSLLDSAVACGNLAVIKVLLSHGAVVGIESLTLAFCGGYVEIVRLFVADGEGKEIEWDVKARKHSALDWWKEKGGEPGPVRDLLREWEMI
ncbi:hypothetical protein HDU97_002462 [Phlyctochytrium planicorne]|nr:hypothetical protein HDU97_002462 [Phlyctochytrium planicorne]